MTFESRICAFAERVLSDRTFDLVVAPALADLQFEQDAGPRRRTENRLAVLRAVAGGLRHDLAPECGSFFALMLLPAGYYVFFLILCFDFLSIEISTNFFVVSALILVLSLGPVMACFWPERRTARPVD
jgi:hypothetical protein